VKLPAADLGIGCWDYCSHQPALEQSIKSIFTAINRQQQEMLRLCCLGYSLNEMDDRKQLTEQLNDNWESGDSVYLFKYLCINIWKFYIELSHH
jgi:hypothetical protein